jgi:hypothetical protein
MLQISDFFKYKYDLSRKLFDYISKNQNLIQYIETSLEILELYAKNSFWIPNLDTDSDEMMAIQELVFRAHRSLEASLLLSITCYELTAVSILRDIMEIELLLHLFMIEPKEIELWWQTKEKRLKKYSPAELRKKVARDDMDLKKRLDIDYKGHSEIMAHATPISLTLQRGVRTKTLANADDMSSIWMCLPEIAYHGGNIARIVSVFGRIFAKDGDTFKKKVETLDRYSEFIKKYSIVSVLITSDRLKYGQKKVSHSKHQ